MEKAELQAVTEAVMRTLSVELEASGRHVHVTKEQAMRLFGHPLTQKRPLSQPGQYLANERVTVIGPKGRFENVAVLGPEREEGQVAISLTDGKTLGITPPVLPSGSLAPTQGILLEGPRGRVEWRQGVIAAQRHIHMTRESAKVMGVRDKQVVRLQVYTARPLIFEDVLVRVSPQFATYVHLDFDEANACGFEKGDLGRILP